MTQERARNDKGEDPWYVGWYVLFYIYFFQNNFAVNSILIICDCFRGNCHPEVLATIRQYYSYPEFLPEDSELPNSENVFFGYEQGAVMHVSTFHVQTSVIIFLN